MTEETPVFRRVVFRPWSVAVREVAGITFFFRNLLRHLEKTVVFIIVRQLGCCLGRGVPEEEKYSNAAAEKNNVVQQQIF